VVNRKGDLGSDRSENKNKPGSNDFPRFPDDYDNSDYDDSDYDDSDYDNSDDDNERIYRRQLLRGPSYPVSQMTPLSMSPVWDEINARLNIRLTGPDSLEGFCEGAHFARSRLTKTSSASLMTQLKQTLLSSVSSR